MLLLVLVLVGSVVWATFSLLLVLVYSEFLAVACFVDEIWLFCF